MKSKYTTKAAAKPYWKNAILLGITALALLASPGVALADCTPVTNWTATSGSWFTSTNWDNGVPNSGIGAVISNGGKASISGSLPLASACSLTVDPGTVSLSNQGSLTVTYGITVGDTSSTIGSSLLAVNSQSSVTVTSGNVQVKSSGTLTGNSTVNSDVSVGNGGTLSPNFTLTINGGLSFGGGGTMQCNVIPSNSGSDAHVTGTAALTNGHLSVTMTGTFSSGTNRYTLLQADGGLNSTTFLTQSITYDPSQGFTPSITYSSDGKYVYLDLTWNQ